MRIDPKLVAPPLSLLYRLWVRSMRYDSGGGLARITAVLDSGRPCMLAIWHEELFALTGYGMLNMPGRLATMASDSRDGELITRVLQRIGYAVARGSSTRGGAKALAQMRRFMRQGHVGVITVDGPRGPRQKVKDGAAYLARKSGAVLFPVRSRLSAGHAFERSWDHFQLPRPFCDCKVFVGHPLDFAAGEVTAEGLAADSLRLEQAMRETLPDVPPSS